jgi:hypothetical protein
LLADDFDKIPQRTYIPISKMLKNLEDELNCTLLIRDGRKLLLTDTGRVATKYRNVRISMIIP